MEYSIIVNIISLIFFPFGFLMYFYWRHTRPLAAKSALKFAFISLAFYLFLDILNVIILY